MPLLLAAIAGGLLVLAFPPFGWGWTSVPAIGLLFIATLRATTARMAWGVGAVFGIAFVWPLVPWLANVEPGAPISFAIGHAVAFAIFSRLVWFGRDWPVWPRLALLLGAWVGVFAVLRHLPVIAVEWADPGYTVVGWEAARDAAAIWGMTGWSVILGVAATGIAGAVAYRRPRLAIGGLAILAGAFVVGIAVNERPTGPAFEVAIVQGHPACPEFPCQTSRQEITANHIAMTEALEPGPDLVVWGESSTGFSTDPGQNPAVQEAIVRETERLDAHLLLGSDRPAGSVNFINANLLFNENGQIVGEYAKQYPVIFGEFVPFRSILGDIPPFNRQPRDIIRGTGPEVLDVGDVRLGTVISYESSFGRFAREHAALGAELLVVTTNEGSFGHGSAADQLIAMTSMRAAELGLDVVHAAVSGKSTIITDGGVPGPRTGSYTEEVLIGTVSPREAPPTPYARWGDWLVALVLIGTGAVALRQGVVAANPVSDELDPVDA